MANTTNELEKKIGIGKIILIMFIIFIITPILILGIVYYANDNFKMEANKYLIMLPGPIGDHFTSYPTENELNNQKSAIAKYLVEIDDNRAIDKLTLIKKEDEVLYNEIIKIMMRLKPKKARTIIDSIRKSLIKKDILTRVTEQIEEEKQEEVLDRAKYLESLSTITAIKEIESDLSNDRITYLELAKVFENIKEKDAVYILKYMDKETREKIIDRFSFDEKKRGVKVLLNTMDDKQLKLKYAAEIYSTENPEKLVGIIGNTDTYTIDDLSFIYRNIGITKGAQILSKLDDENFVHELVNAIKEKEVLINGEDLLTDDILRAYKVYRDFDSNVRELTSIYEKMSDEQIAELIKGMIVNSSSPKSYPLDNEGFISISDEDLALSILREFNERKLASILSNLDTDLASEITKKLSMPVI